MGSPLQVRLLIILIPITSFLDIPAYSVQVRFNTYELVLFLLNSPFKLGKKKMAGGLSNKCQLFGSAHFSAVSPCPPSESQGLSWALH